MASKYGTDQFHGNVSDYYTFVQFAESHDSTNVKMLLDRSPSSLNGVTLPCGNTLPRLSALMRMCPG